MLRKMNTIALIVLLLITAFCFSHSVWSAVYKCENDFGKVKFSDEPCARGESSSRIKWLKPGSTAAAKNRRKKSPSKSSQLKIHTQQPVALVTLLTTTQLKLSTESLSSSRGNEISENLELILADGIRLDLSRVKNINIKKSTRSNEILAHIVMADGYESLQTIAKPFPIISGDINIGRFSKSLADIKTLEFFNSNKLPQKQKKHKLATHEQLKPAPETAAPMNREEVPVIELDMSEPAQQKNSFNPAIEPKIKTSAIPYRQNSAAANVAEQQTNTNTDNNKPVSRPVNTSQMAEVTLINDKRSRLQKNTLESRRGTASARQQLILSNNIRIPFKDIKQIKVRPASDKSAIVVAVHLLTGEIKMENMSPPFTEISGQSGSQHFSRSLLEVKSIRLK